MTNELQPGEFIDEFVRVVNRTDTAKINLNYSASQLANFDAIRDMILNKRPDEVLTVHTDRKIKRKRKDGREQILSEAEDKIYSFVFQDKAVKR